MQWLNNRINPISTSRQQDHCGRAQTRIVTNWSGLHIKCYNHFSTECRLSSRPTLYLHIIYTVHYYTCGTNQTQCHPYMSTSQHNKHFNQFQLNSNIHKASKAGNGLYINHIKLSHAISGSSTWEWYCIRGVAYIPVHITIHSPCGVALGGVSPEANPECN